LIPVVLPWLDFVRVVVLTILNVKYLKLYHVILSCRLYNLRDFNHIVRLKLGQ